MSRVSRRPEAERDLIAIFAHIGRDSPLAAERFLDACQATFQRLAFAPGIGRRRLDLHLSLGAVRSLRVEGFPNHVIIYEPLPDGIVIVRVLDARRHLPGIALGDL